jgi:hypothetical protein
LTLTFVQCYPTARNLWDKEHHMTRIAGVTAREAGPLVKLAYFFTRRQIARLTVMAY